MSLQWTFIATFLYLEIALLVLFLLPFISATRWNRIFKSRLLSSIGSHANIYFHIFMVILLVLFVDSIRDVRKYSGPSDADLQANPQAETLLHMKLFRAQRNFYIAGFALFLFLVLRRITTLLSTTAQLTANNEAAQRQAESATAAAKKMLEEKENKANEKEEQTGNEQELSSTRKELAKVKEELTRTQVDLDAMRRQAESTNKEYDRLLEECAALQDQVKTLEGEGGTKKDA